MLKNILVTILYLAMLVLFSINATPLFNENCVVAVSRSSGEFYSVNSYRFKDVFVGDGVSVTYSPSYNFKKEIIDYYGAEIVINNNYDSYAKNYYCYSKALPNAVIINGKKVNIHIAVTENAVTVGFPLIYYSY